MLLDIETTCPECGNQSHIDEDVEWGEGGSSHEADVICECGCKYKQHFDVEVEIEISVGKTEVIQTSEGEQVARIEDHYSGDLFADQRGESHGAAT